VISQDNRFFWVYGHCTRHGNRWLRASTQTPLRMPDLRVTSVWLRLAYYARTSCPNAVVRRHCYWLASSATQCFMVDVCKRRRTVSNYDDAFSRETGRRPKGSIAPVLPDSGDFRSTPVNGHSYARQACLKSANTGSGKPSVSMASRGLCGPRLVVDHAITSRPARRDLHRPASSRPPPSTSVALQRSSPC
jgi:hypothetical protein